jgi:ketol-acid reductoisomerase
MKQILSEIQSGQFAKEWISIYKKQGKDAFVNFLQQIEKHQIEKVGKEMRDMMWPDSLGNQ